LALTNEPFSSGHGGGEPGSAARHERADKAHGTEDRHRQERAGPCEATKNSRYQEDSSHDDGDRQLVGTLAAPGELLVGLRDGGVDLPEIVVGDRGHTTGKVDELVGVEVAGLIVDRFWLST
jgi:hypothetical protein